MSSITVLLRPPLLLGPYEHFLSCCLLKDLSHDPALWRKLSLRYERIMNRTQACREHISQCTSLKEIYITGADNDGEEEEELWV